jgi:hypothetical protein
MVTKDAAARLQCLQRLNYARLAVQLAIAAAPVGTENRGHFARAVRKAAYRAVSTTADDLDGLSSALEDVAAKYTNMPLSGIFKLSNPVELSRVLFLPVAPASVTASAVSHAKGAPAKSGARPPSAAEQPRLQQPSTAPGKSGTPPAFRRLCSMGDKCTHVELAWDPASGPGRTCDQGVPRLSPL